jgi:polar amino acid transport system substrate-binding protein
MRTVQSNTKDEFSAGEAMPMMKAETSFGKALVVFAAVLAPFGITPSAGQTASPPAGADSASRMANFSAKCTPLRAQYPSLVGREIAIAVTPEPNQMIVAPNVPSGFEGELVDYAEALSSCLGFKYSLTSLGFSGIIPAVQAGHFQMALAAMYDTAPREKQVTYVDYDTINLFVVVKKGNPLNITKAGAPDLCGVAVTEPAGSYEEALVSSISEECTRSGKAAVNLLRFPSVSDAFQALAAGRGDVHIDGGSDVQGFTESHPDFQIAVGPFPGPATGAQFEKSETTLQQAVLTAWTLMWSTGVESDILSKWHGSDTSTLIEPKLRP